MTTESQISVPLSSTNTNANIPTQPLAIGGKQSETHRPNAETSDQNTKTKDEDSSLSSIDNFDSDNDDDNSENTEKVPTDSKHLKYHRLKFDKRISVPLNDGTTFIDFAALQSEAHQTSNVTTQSVKIFAVSLEINW